MSVYQTWSICDLKKNPAHKSGAFAITYPGGATTDEVGGSTPRFSLPKKQAITLQVRGLWLDKIVPIPCSPPGAEPG
jgi:hypothetical protein